MAADVLHRAIGPTGDKLISLLIRISALGAINGMIFTGARIYYAMGTEHRLYAWLGRWSPRWQTPVRSLAVQAAVTLALILGFGQRAGGFESMVKFTTPVFWIFFFLVGLTLPVLRRRQPDLPRPFRVPLYPWLPAVFCLSSLFMLYSSLSYAVENRTYEALWSVGLLLVGVFGNRVGKFVQGSAKGPVGRGVEEHEPHQFRLSVPAEELDRRAQGDAGGLIHGIAIGPGAEGGQGDAAALRGRRPVRGSGDGGGQQFRFAAMPAAPDRPHGVDDPFCRQVARGGNDGRAGGAAVGVLWRRFPP